MELMQAHKQWSERPADERFATLAELHDATKRYRETSGERSVPWSSLRVEAQDEEVILTRGATPSRLTHWSFGQLASRVGAPAGYLRGLPPTLAAQNLNHGLAHGAPAGDAQMLMHSNGSLLCRALTTEKYTRIWNDEVAQRLQSLPTSWKVPPAAPVNPRYPGARLATEADIIAGMEGGIQIRPGDTIAPAGIYASDHDLFVFLVNTERQIQDGTAQGLFRGVFVENSEVGASAFKVTAFLLRGVCGNHIVWGASSVSTISIRHVGAADRRFGRELVASFQRFADDSASGIEARIVEAKALRLGDTKDAVLDAVFKKLDLSRKALETGYDAVKRSEDGDPRTAWGLVQGLTRASQETPYADERARLDKAAAKILSF